VQKLKEENKALYDAVVKRTGKSEYTERKEERDNSRGV
jgi:hypothetical protein